MIGLLSESVTNNVEVVSLLKDKHVQKMKICAQVDRAVPSDELLVIHTHVVSMTFDFRSGKIALKYPNSDLKPCIVTSVVPGSSQERFFFSIIPAPFPSVAISLS